MNVLGIRSYHFAEVLANDENDHIQLWMRALRAKYEGVGKPFKGEDFDKILWNYDVSCRVYFSIVMVSPDLFLCSCVRTFI